MKNGSPPCAGKADRKGLWKLDTVTKDRAAHFSYHYGHRWTNQQQQYCKNAFSLLCLCTNIFIYLQLARAIRRLRAALNRTLTNLRNRLNFSRIRLRLNFSRFRLNFSRFRLRLNFSRLRFNFSRFRFRLNLTRYGKIPALSLEKSLLLYYNIDFLLQLTFESHTFPHTFELHPSSELIRQKETWNWRGWTSIIVGETATEFRSTWIWI